MILMACDALTPVNLVKLICLDLDLEQIYVLKLFRCVKGEKFLLKKCELGEGLVTIGGVFNLWKIVCLIKLNLNRTSCIIKSNKP